ncbi:MAG: hypothetical protein ACKO5A_03375 [Actinomycetota bacterium]
MSAPSVVVVGAGVLGARVTRELLGLNSDGTPAVDRLTLVGRRPARLAELSGPNGTPVRMIEADEPPADVLGEADVVVIARAARDQLSVATRAVSAGAHVVATSDDLEECRSLLKLSSVAISAGRSVAVGVAMAPGLSCLLARHAMALFDGVDEIHVARVGAGGPSCARQRRRALRGTGVEYRDGEWLERPGFSGRELVWFPDPIGGADCYRAALADPVLIVDAVFGLRRASARLAASRVDRGTFWMPMFIGPPAEGAPGAVRVEVRGQRNGERHDVVYGVFDRPAVAGAATAAVAALAAARGDLPHGAHGLAAVDNPVVMLRELARRGVRAATFVGSREFGIDEPSEEQQHP